MIDALPANGTDVLAVAIRKLDELFVPTPAHANALRQLEGALRMHLLTGKTVGVVLTGESGVGKTRILNEFDRIVAGVDPVVDGTRAPLFRVESPAVITPLALSSAVLEGTGDPFAHQGTERVNKGRIKALFAERRPLGFALDEFHNFISDRPDYSQKRTLRTLKEFSNRLNVIIILTGMNDIRTWIAQDRELHGRFKRFIHLPRLGVQNKTTFRAFRNFFFCISEIVPFSDDFNANADTDVLRMLLASKGIIRTLIELNKDACNGAWPDSRTKVSLDDLAEAFDLSSPELDPDMNPFRMNADRVRKEAGRLFEKHAQVTS